MTILTTVTDAEAKVVDAVRELQGPVVEYVRKGVDLAGERLPKVSYPATFPKPVEVIDSQYEFVTALLAAQHELVKAVAETVSPLVGAQAPKAKATTAKATKAAKSAA